MMYGQLKLILYYYKCYNECMQVCILTLIIALLCTVPYRSVVCTNLYDARCH